MFRSRNEFNAIFGFHDGYGFGGYDDEMGFSRSGWAPVSQGARSREQDVRAFSQGVKRLLGSYAGLAQDHSLSRDVRHQ